MVERGAQERLKCDLYSIATSVSVLSWRILTGARPHLHQRDDRLVDLFARAVFVAGDFPDSIFYLTGPRCVVL